LGALARASREDDTPEITDDLGYGDVTLRWQRDEAMPSSARASP